MAMYEPAMFRFDGITPVYSFNFPYLSKEHIHVFFENEETTDYIWLDDNTIQLTRFPAPDTAITIQRETDINNRLVDYQAGAILDEETLNKDSNQLFFILQENLSAMQDTARQYVLESYQGVSGQFVDDLLEGLKGKIGDDQLVDELLTRINHVNLGDFIFDPGIFQETLYQTLMEQLLEYGENISNAKIDIDEINSTIDLLAYQTTVDELSNRISLAEIAIDGAKADILLRAYQTDFNELESTVNGALIRLDGAEADIQLRATHAEVNEQAGRIDQALIDIDGLNTQISLKASQLEVDNLSASLAQTDVTVNEHGVRIVNTEQTTEDLGQTIDDHTSELNLIKNQFTVKINNNNAVAGFGLMLEDNGYSEFAVAADCFKLVNPSNPSQRVQLFTDGLVNGYPTVILDSGAIEDAGITGTKIAPNVIEASHIQANTITSGQLATENIIISGQQLSDYIIDTAHMAYGAISDIDYAYDAVGYQDLSFNWNGNNNSYDPITLRSLTSPYLNTNETALAITYGCTLYVDDLGGYDCDGNERMLFILYLYRGSTLIHTSVILERGFPTQASQTESGGLEVAPFTIYDSETVTCLDFPPAGSAYNYYLKIVTAGDFNNFATQRVYYRYLSISQFKR